MYANDFWCHWAFGTVFVARLCCVSAPVSRLDRTMRPTPLERETPPWNLLLFFYNIDVTTEFTMCHSDRFLSRFVNAVHVNHERRNFNWPRNLWELFSVFGFSNKFHASLRPDHRTFHEYPFSALRFVWHFKRVNKFRKHSQRSARAIAIISHWPYIFQYIYLCIYIHTFRRAWARRKSHLALIYLNPEIAIGTGTGAHLFVLADAPFPLSWGYYAWEKSALNQQQP